MINKRISNLFIALVFLSTLVLIFNDNIDYRVFRAALRFPINPFIRSMDFITEVIGRDMSEDLLTQYLSESNLEKTHLKYLKRENDLLRSMLEFRSSSEYSLTPAEVIGGNPSNESEIIINRGKKDNLKEGMCVLFLKGIVGKVIECAQNYSIVETHSNMNFKVGVCDKDKKYYMVAYFYSKGLLKVENIQYDVILNEGDSLFTSGFGNIYPPDICVGTIKKTVKSTDGEYFYLISPAENIGALKFVYIAGKQSYSLPSIFSEDANYSEGAIGWYKILRRQR